MHGSVAASADRMVFSVAPGLESHIDTEALMEEESGENSDDYPEYSATETEDEGEGGDHDFVAAGRGRRGSSRRSSNSGTLDDYTGHGGGAGGGSLPALSLSEYGIEPLVSADELDSMSEVALGADRMEQLTILQRCVEAVLKINI